MSTIELLSEVYIIKNSITKDEDYQITIEDNKEDTDMITVINKNRAGIIFEGDYFKLKDLITSLDIVYETTKEKEEEKARIKKEIEKRKQQAANGLSVSEDKEGALSIFKRKKV